MHARRFSACVLVVGLACMTSACVTPPAVAPRLTLLADATPEQCPTGGFVLRSGPDVDFDGVLSEREVDEEQSVCNGATGPDGPSTLVRFDDEPPGERCPAGGLAVRWGVDEDRSGSLEAGEIRHESVVCSGAAGARVLFAKAVLEPGLRCEFGGQVVETGVDDDLDGVLDPDEVESSIDVCNGPTTRSAEIVTERLPNGRIRGPYLADVEVLGLVDAALAWSLDSGALPPGLTLYDGPSARISGFPTTAGVFTFRLRATDPLGNTTSKVLGIEVDDPPLVTVRALASLRAGVMYDDALQATGGRPPYRWSLHGGVLPEGLSLANTGRITGVPVSDPGARLLVGVTDSDGRTARGSVLLRSEPSRVVFRGVFAADRVSSVHLADLAANPPDTRRLLSDSGLPPSSTFHREAHSPDQRWAAIVGNTGQPGAWWLDLVGPASPIRLGTVDPKAFEPLLASPDGRWLAFIEDSTSTLGETLVLVDVAGPTPGTPFRWRIPNDRDSLVASIQFSPDGSRLAFTSHPGRGGPRSLLVFTLSDLAAGPTTIPTGGASVDEIAWTPDGSRIVFSGSTSSLLELYVVRLLGGAVTKVSGASPFIRGGFQLSAASLSPDGEQLAFVGDRDRDGEDGLFLTRMTDDGTAPVHAVLEPTDDVREVSSFSWSPDGSTLAVRADLEVDGQLQLHVIDALSERPRPLLVTPALPLGTTVDSIAWGPGGSDLLFRADLAARRQHELWRVPFAGTPTAVPLVDPSTGFSALVGNWIVSPDGDVLAFAGADTEGGACFLLDLDRSGTRPEVVDRAAADAVYVPLAFTRPDSLLFSRFDDPTRTAWIARRRAADAFDRYRLTPADAVGAGFSALVPFP